MLCLFNLYRQTSCWTRIIPSLKKTQNGTWKKHRGCQHEEYKPSDSEMVNQMEIRPGLQHPYQKLLSAITEAPSENKSSNCLWRVPQSLMGYSLVQIPTHMSREEIPGELYSSQQLRHHPLKVPKGNNASSCSVKKTPVANKKSPLWLKTIKKNCFLFRFSRHKVLMSSPSPLQNRHCTKTAAWASSQVLSACSLWVC